MVWGLIPRPYIPLETILVLVSLGKSLYGRACGADCLRRERNERCLRLVFIDP